ncbi:MAG: STAS domain-containing protein [Chloroflexi bacterium]|nr:STAS domain-containing protein [Chloroflexota bacterium]
MTIQQESLSSDLWLLQVDGRLDQRQNGDLEQHLLQLLDADHSSLIVDMTAVTYINSGGLRCLVTAWRRAKQQGGNLVLCGLNPRLQEIFGMVGFDKVFQIAPSLEMAQAEFQLS